MQKVTKKIIDGYIFYPATLITLLMSLIFLIYPSKSNHFLNAIHAYITNEFSWFFLLTTFMAIIACIYLIFSPFGNVILGQKNDKPDFKTITWMGMIFTSGTGGSLLYLASVEWIWIMQSPPFGIEPLSQDAARWASAYGMFHWGPSAWAWYLISAVPIAYFFYVKKYNSLKISAFTKPLIGKYSDGLGGHIINFLYMFGILGGVMTSLALGTPLISNLLAFLFDMDSTNAYVDTFVIFLWTFIPLFTLILGLKKGLAILSDWNVKLDLLLLILIAVCGPLSFILNQSVDGLGLMLQNFVYMSFATDIIGEGQFPQTWTVFYFSWWVVYALPFGLFIAKISKGRKIKEVMICGLFAGTLGCIIFYMVLGNFGIYSQLNGIDLISVMESEGRGGVVLSILQSLPYSSVFIFLFGLVVLISYITGHCAVGYTLAAATQREMKSDSDPNKFNIAFWLILAGVVSLSLYFLSPESLKPLQTVSILTGFPLCIVIFLIFFSFIKQVNLDHRGSCKIQGV